MASRPYWRTRRQTPSAKQSVQPATLEDSNLRATSENSVHTPSSNGASEGSREERRLWVKKVLAECQNSKSLLHVQPEGPPQGDGFIGLFIEVSRWQADWRSENVRRRGSKSLFGGRIGYQRPLDTLKIGEGTTFAVYRRYDNGGMLGREPKFVVMKDSKIRFERDGTAKDKAVMSGLLAEIRVLSQEPLRMHKNIVKLLDIRWDHPNLDHHNLGPTLYLEYAELGTLTDFCASGNRQRIDLAAARSILLNIWDGLHALHGCGIVHGDVKPSNVLLFPEGPNVIAKISDFGCAVFIKELKEEKVELAGRSPPWDAPEAGSEIKRHLLVKTDIYSYGLLYWWFQLGGQDPFSIDSNKINNIFHFSGPRESKLEALKKLKQTEDLDDRMHQSVMSIQNENGYQISEFHDELKSIGSLTLRKKPEERMLGVISHPFT
jgi:serine/threonine protein kinase